MSVSLGHTTVQIIRSVKIPMDLTRAKFHASKTTSMFFPTLILFLEMVLF